MSETEKSAPATAPASSSAPAPAGKKNSTTIILIIVIVLVVLGGIGYAAQRYFARKIAERIVEDATGLDVSTSGNGGVTMSNGSDTISTGNKAKWPSTMPSDVPEFKSGTIESSTSSNTTDYKNWSANFSGVTTDNCNSYFSTLANQSWAQTDTVDMGFFINRTFEKGALRLNFTFDPDSKGATLTVTNI